MNNPKRTLSDLAGFWYRWQPDGSGKTPKSGMIVRDKRLCGLHILSMTFGEESEGDYELNRGAADESQSLNQGNLE